MTLVPNLHDDIRTFLIDCQEFVFQISRQNCLSSRSLLHGCFFSSLRLKLSANNACSVQTFLIKCQGFLLFFRIFAAKLFLFEVAVARLFYVSFSSTSPQMPRTSKTTSRWRSLNSSDSIQTLLTQCQGRKNICEKNTRASSFSLPRLYTRVLGSLFRWNPSVGTLTS